MWLLAYVQKYFDDVIKKDLCRIELVLCVKFTQSDFMKKYLI